MLCLMLLQMLTIPVALQLAAAAPPPPARAFDARPEVAGSLHVAVESAAAFLQLAQGRAARLQTAEVHIAAGRHHLSEPLVLGARHSGIRFVGLPGESIVSGAIVVGGATPDGGSNVTGWEVAGPANCSGCGDELWRAPIPKGADSRQFYVNGRRANRTWVAFPQGSSKAATATAITVPGMLLQSFRHNVTGMELVYRGGTSAGSQWQESRCPCASIVNGTSTSSDAQVAVVAAAPSIVAGCAADFCDAPLCPECCGTKGRCTCADTGALVNKTKDYGSHHYVVCPKAKPICVGYVFDSKWGTCETTAPPSAGTTTVEVAQPCVWNGNIKIAGSQPLRVPAYIENVFELLGTARYGHPGDFFVDSVAGFVYYAPHAEETRVATVGHLPMVEHLVLASGVSGVSYNGIVFEHATWMAPSGPAGFVDIQGGYCMVCPVGDDCSHGSASKAGGAEARETPAALQFVGSKGVSFTRCTFRRLGSNGIGFAHGMILPWWAVASATSHIMIVCGHQNALLGLRPSRLDSSDVVRACVRRVTQQ